MTNDTASTPSSAPVAALAMVTIDCDDAHAMARFWSELLGGQTERVVAHAVQDVLARHAVIPRIDVGGDVAQRVTDVQARA